MNRSQARLYALLSIGRRRLRGHGAFSPLSYLVPRIVDVRQEMLRVDVFRLIELKTPSCIFNGR